MSERRGIRAVARDTIRSMDLDLHRLLPLIVYVGTFAIAGLFFTLRG